MYEVNCQWNVFGSLYGLCFALVFGGVVNSTLMELLVIFSSVFVSVILVRQFLIFLIGQLTYSSRLICANVNFGMFCLESLNYS